MVNDLLSEHPAEARGTDTEKEPGEGSTMSLQQSILQYREEHGRTYHRYKDGSK